MPSIGLPPPPFGEKGIVDKIVLAGCYQVVCSVLKAVEAIVDATIINAPSSTKNADKARSQDASDEEGQPVVWCAPSAASLWRRPRRAASRRAPARGRGRCRQSAALPTNRKAPPLGQYRAVGDIGRCGHHGVDQLGATVHPEMRLHAEIPLSHGQETRVWGDQAYRGQRAVIREHAPKARDFTNRR